MTMHGDKPLRMTLWLTGLPCSGKTTLAKKIKEELSNRSYRAVHLDGDDVRGALNEDLGFSPEDRKENLRRVAHVARLFNQNGHFVVASFISPTDELRRMVKQIIGDFKLVYLRCGLEACEARDVKGMYRRARLNEIPAFTGISAPFEEPRNPDLTVDTQRKNIDECVGEILGFLGVQPKIKDKTKA